MAKSTTRCQCGSTRSRNCRCTADYPRPAGNSRLQESLGSSRGAGTPRHRQGGKERKARTCGQGSVTPAEPILLPSAPLHPRLELIPWFVLKPQRGHTDTGTRSCRRDGQMQNNRFQKEGVLENPPFILSNLFPLTCSWSCGCPAIRICLGRGPGAAARFSFQGSSPGKVTRG